MEIISQKGKRKFAHDGYLYVFGERSKKDPELLFWRCERKQFCKGRIHTKDGKVMKIIGLHTHDPSALKVEVAQVKTDLKRKAENRSWVTNSLVKTSTEEAPLEVQHALPQAASMKATVRRVRKKMSPSLLAISDGTFNESEEQPSSTSDDNNLPSHSCQNELALVVATTNSTEPAEKKEESQQNDSTATGLELPHDDDNPMIHSSMEVISQKGRRKFAHEGYLYIYSECSKTDPELLFWRCQRKAFCKGRIHTKHGEVKKVSGNHTHPPSLMQVAAAVKRKAEAEAEAQASGGPFFVKSQSICMVKQPAVRRPRKKARPTSMSHFDSTATNSTFDYSRSQLSLLPDLYQLSNRGNRSGETEAVPEDADTKASVELADDEEPQQRSLTTSTPICTRKWALPPVNGRHSAPNSSQELSNNDLRSMLDQVRAGLAQRGYPHLDQFDETSGGIRDFLYLHEYMKLFN